MRVKVLAAVLLSLKAMGQDELETRASSRGRIQFGYLKGSERPEQLSYSKGRLTWDQLLAKKSISEGVSVERQRIESPLDMISSSSARKQTSTSTSRSSASNLLPQEYNLKNAEKQSTIIQKETGTLGYRSSDLTTNLIETKLTIIDTEQRRIALREEILASMHSFALSRTKLALNENSATHVDSGIRDGRGMAERTQRFREKRRHVTKK
jgi:hypothetical protein